MLRPAFLRARGITIRLAVGPMRGSTANRKPDLGEFQNDYTHRTLDLDAGSSS